MRIFDKKKKGLTMKQPLIFGGAVLASATAASAHPGAHVHPHDGAHWLVIVAALAVLTIAGGLAAARARSRK
jgi:hypothetical protein